jgi:hypothetical protein
VLSVSEKHNDVAGILAIIEVLLLPPKESFKRNVNLESL